MPNKMKQRVLHILKQSGIPLFGIAPMPEKDRLLECRAKYRLPENAKSIIVCLFPYYSEGLENGNISRYAMVEDYHLVAGDMLEQACQRLEAELDHRFCWFADDSPIPEVSAAAQAGLGIIGRQGLLITRDYGTYQFIGEIVTDLELEPDKPSSGSCLGCGKCELHCPGNAIESGKLDKNRCASRINQLKRRLDEEENLLVGRCGSVWGCDICQEACPHNRGIKQTPIRRFRENIICSVSPETIPELIKTRAFGFRGSGPLLRNYGIIYPEPGNNRFTK